MMSSTSFVAKMIAVDGPAGSGKSTLGRELAARLNYLYFDTGVMYRALTLAVLQRGLAVADEAQVAALADTLVMDIVPPSVEDGRDCDVLVEGVDVTLQLRSPEVNANVSQVSAYPGVRRALTAQQRRIGLRGRVVMVGRDIGTAVLPEADLKIYLDASVEERALRRWTEDMQRAGAGAPSLEQTLASLQARDQIDSTRAVAPLKPAEDAIHIDSDQMTVEQVVEFAYRLATGQSALITPETAGANAHSVGE